MLGRVLAVVLLLPVPLRAAFVEPARVELPPAPLTFSAASSAAVPLSPASALPAALAAPSASAAPASAPAPARAAWDDARAVARRLGAGRGVPGAGHDYFYEMLARYLYNGRDDAALAELARRPEAIGEAPAADRWAGKLARDLAEPYDDAAALARLDHLQRELEDLARALKARAPDGGYRLLLMGGLLRGRLSAHSDVDLMLDTRDEALLNETLAGPFGYLTKERDAVVGPVPKNARLRDAMGEVFDLGDGRVVLEDPGLVRRLFFRARAALAAAPMERDAPLDAELMARIKRLGALLDRARDEAERRRLETEIDAFADELPPPVAPLVHGRAKS